MLFIDSAIRMPRWGLSLNEAVGVQTNHRSCTTWPLAESRNLRVATSVPHLVIYQSAMLACLEEAARLTLCLL
jgi:hypothetical protein